MRLLLAALALSLAACSPPAPPAADAPPPAPAAPVADLGPYSNSWDAAEFSRFRQTLHARTAGDHTVRLQAQTDSPGGETVAVYPVGEDGARRTVRILFVIADTDGASAEAVVAFPEGGAGVPVEVVVENAGGRRHAGTYTLTVD